MSSFGPIRYTPPSYAGSPPIREEKRGYRRQSTDEYRDEPANLTPRQAYFYQCLIDIALAIGSRHIPVDFRAADGRRMRLDHGCIKIAEHAGFIEPLRNDDENGQVGHITLAWCVTTDDRTSR